MWLSSLSTLFYLKSNLKRNKIQTDASMIYHRSLANKRINATGVNKYDKEYLLTRFYNQRKEKKKLEISNKLMEQFYDVCSHDVY